MPNTVRPVDPAWAASEKSRRSTAQAHSNERAAARGAATAHATCTAGFTAGQTTWATTSRTTSAPVRHRTTGPMPRVRMSMRMHRATIQAYTMPVP